MSVPLSVADYQVKFETLCLGGFDYRIRSLLDRQQYSDPDGAAGRAGISSASWPLFGLVWPSARILAGIVQTLPIAGKRILEIGCGLGLASLVMRRRGADITASDLHPLAAGFLAENLDLNQLQAVDFRTGSWADADPGLGRFDLIVGSDVLYERGLPGELSGFIDRHSSPAVEVIIVDPDRGNRAVFNRNMAELGYRHEESRAASHQEDGEPYKGRVLNYRRGN
jgi:2-polyprenyl-3-methyl-5-hydroxy-6-metoxy-1,4-benzoquinol methylase